MRAFVTVHLNGGNNLLKKNKACALLSSVMKTPASVRLEPEVFTRIQTLATVDRRSISEIVAMCAEAGLPQVEAAIKARGKFSYPECRKEISVIEDRPVKPKRAA